MIISEKARLQILLLSFFLFGALLLWRLFYWQVTRGSELAKIGRSQYAASRTIPSARGSILASDNFPLAASKESWLLWASPQKIDSAKETARKLAPLLVVEPLRLGAESELKEASESAKTKEELLKEEEQRIEDVLNKKEAQWVPVKRRVAREIKVEIEKINIAGLGFDPEEDRNYPESSMAAHILGFLGKASSGQNKGYFGLEGYYDSALSGSSGTKAWEKDATGKPILLGKSHQINALNGISLKTHINRSIQFALERRLEEGLRKYGSSKGVVVVMRPRDGAILAMAALPAFDPAKYTSFDQAIFANPAVSESFEPGSIFKVLIMAAALDASAVSPDMRCDVCSGPRRIGEYTIKTWNEEYYPNSTPAEIIQHSDNIGMIWAAEKLGKDKLYEYLSNFGIGRETGIDLQGEADPNLRPASAWGLIDLATISFGQGVAVTPIQMARAVAAIANKGELPVPQVVDRMITQGWEQDILPQKEGRVISEDAARQITEMMVGAVDSGEAKWAKPKDFRIAGKTGTAQIPVSGHYDKEKTIASFVGFAPADNPEFVMLVSLHEPTSSPWGSETAAPLWFSIAKDILPILGIHPGR